MKKNESRETDEALANEPLRSGDKEGPRPTLNPFVVRSRPIGIADKVNLDNIEEAFDILEGKDRKW